jgi:hypothetical protein
MPRTDAERLNSFLLRGWPEPPPGVKVPKQFQPFQLKGMNQALYDTGGILPPGVTLAVNNTGGNEYVSREPIGDVNVTVHVHGNVTAEKELAKTIAKEVRDELLRVGARNGGKNGL